MQGNGRSDDPSTHGLKFDAGKDRWDLMPIEPIFDMMTSVSKSFDFHPELYSNFDEKKIIHSIDNGIDRWAYGYNVVGQVDYTEIINLGLVAVAFDILFLIRGKPYSSEEIGHPELAINREDIRQVVRVYTHGAVKYADWNWLKVSKARYYSALRRHVAFLGTDEKYDANSGMLHAYHAVWNCFALHYLEIPVERRRNKLLEISGIKPEVAIPRAIMESAEKLKSAGSPGISIKPSSVKKKKAR